MRTYDVEKLAQIVAYLMKRKVGIDCENYTKNLRLAFWANREALRLWERPITNDETSAMHLGPTLSMLYDLMKGKAPRQFQLVWDRYFTRKDYDLVIEIDPGEEDLSERECSLLSEVQDRFSNYSYERLIDFLHDSKNVPEYEDPGFTSILIPLGSILRKLDKDEKQCDVIEKEIVYHNHIATLLEE
jgi:uncharacterized phage-associated protein